MKNLFTVSLCLMSAGAGVALADAPIVLFPPLPTPLTLPPGLTETLPLNSNESFFGDALRAVDCTDATDLPYGTCGNQLFGGVVMTDSHLSGSITIQFFPPLNNISHFIVTQGVLQGTDGVLSAPLGYSLPVKSNQISDGLQLSSGDLDLTTGAAKNIQWYVAFSNTALLALGNVNPNLAPPIINFPGVRGDAYAIFSQRSDGLLDMYFRGSTFLPLGSNINGEPVRFPLPFCSANGNCASTLARGTSLHPHLYLETAPSSYPPCAPNCPAFDQNHQSVFTAHAAYTAFGDDFEMDIPQLYCPPGSVSTAASSCAVNGVANGRSELQGRFQIQFGQQTGNTLPFQISTIRPSGLFADPPVSPLLGVGFQPGLLGTNQILTFPNFQYHQFKLSFADEPFNFAQGMIDLNTGRIIGQFEYPMFIDQTIIEALFDENNGRVEKDPFFIVASKPYPGQPETLYALFEQGANGETTFRFSGLHERSFATYTFPNPDFIAADAFTGGPDGNLNIFTRFQGSRLNGPPSTISKAGTGAFVSSTGDNFTYSFSMPCNPAGQPFSFTYTNQGNGPPAPYGGLDTGRAGTFTMHSLVSVSCTNSHVSTAAPGDYDIVNFTGFGSWSNDPADSLYRFASVSASVDPNNPYAAIIVYRYQPTANNSYDTYYDLDVELSSAENKPANKPVP